MIITRNNIILKLLVFATDIHFAELEGKRYIKTLFEKDEDYIAIQDSLARLDLEAAKKKVQYDRTYETLESSVNRNFDYIKNLEESLKKLED